MDKEDVPHIYTCVCVCVCVYIYTHIDIHMCIYIYTHTHIPTHTHTHTHMHTMGYYSAIKKNEILPFSTTWMDLEGIMLI